MCFHLGIPCSIWDYRTSICIFETHSYLKLILVPFACSEDSIVCNGGSPANQRYHPSQRLCFVIIIITQLISKIDQQSSVCSYLHWQNVCCSILNKLCAYDSSIHWYINIKIHKTLWGLLYSLSSTFQYKLSFFVCIVLSFWGIDQSKGFSRCTTVLMHTNYQLHWTTISVSNWMYYSIHNYW